MKMNQLMGVSHQLSHSHGIQLAIFDVLYKKKPGKTDEEEEIGNATSERESEEDIAEEETVNEGWQEEVPDENIELAGIFEL